jgi:hypothetical protein
MKTRLSCRVSLTPILSQGKGQVGAPAATLTPEYVAQRLLGVNQRLRGSDDLLGAELNLAIQRRPRADGADAFGDKPAVFRQRLLAGIRERAQ